MANEQKGVIIVLKMGNRCLLLINFRVTVAWHSWALTPSERNQGLSRAITEARSSAQFLQIKCEFSFDVCMLGVSTETTLKSL